MSAQADITLIITGSLLAFAIIAILVSGKGLCNPTFCNNNE
jgi:hypothetical protein